MLRNTLQKRLRIECLEEKIALAGNLTVEVIDGDLVITGDANPNSFTLDKPGFIDTQNGAQYELHNRGLFGDTINGDLNDTLLISGVTRDIIINLGEGDDIARIFGFVSENFELSVPRDLSINAGAGNDQIYLGIFESFEFGRVESGPINVGRNLSINGGAGDELVLTTDVNVANDYTVVDTVGDIVFQNFNGVEFDGGDSMYVGGDVSLTTGSGNDFVDFVDFVVDGDVTMSFGAGDDAVGVGAGEIGGNLVLSLGSGGNQAQASLLTVGGGILIVGSGSNAVGVGFLEADSVTVLTGNNDDYIEMRQVAAGTVTIATSGGADYAILADSAFDLLMVNLGAGNDTLELQGVDVSLLALLIGGRGSDTFNDLGGNDINFLLDLGFEIFGEAA